MTLHLPQYPNGASPAGTWTDLTPVMIGAYRSLRTDAASVQFDDVAVSDVVKYYAAGGTRVAVRKAGAVSYLFGDHPSTALRTGSRQHVGGLQCVYRRDSDAALQAVGRVTRAERRYTHRPQPFVPRCS